MWLGTKWIGILALSLSAVSLGCATAERMRAGRVAAGSATVTAPAAGEYATASATIAPQEKSPYQLTAGQLPDPHAEHMRTPDVAGHVMEALPPPPTQSQGLDAPQGFALEGEPLTLASLERMASHHNPTLLQAQAQVRGELGKAIQAGLWPNPTLSYVQEQIGVEGTPGEFVGGIVRQRFVTANKLALSEAKFLAQTEAAEWHALEQQYRVLNDVRIHYFRVRGRYELMQIHRDLLKSAEDSLLTTREQYNVGQATMADVHMANVRFQRAQLDLMQIENEYDEAFEQLSALVGVQLPCAPLATSLVGDLSPIAWCDAEGRIMAESPELQAARSKLASDRITIERERAEPWPDVVLEGGAGYNFETDQTVGAATLSLDVPLFDRNQGTILQAQADYARQQAEYRRVELMLQRELARVYRDYLTALQHASTYEQVILPEARKAYELQLKSYQDDRISWPEVLRTQEEYFMLRAEYVRQLIAWREAEVLISGFLLHDGLMPPSSPPPAGHIDSVPKPR